MKTLILGIGNLLRSDDGVGLHIIEKLGEKNLGAGVDLKEASSGLDILDAIKGYDRIVIVDAIQTGGKPGTVYKLSLEDLEYKQTLHSFSTHLGMDFPAILELGRKLSPGGVPEDIVFVAIEAEDITTISDRCTPKVEKAVGSAIELIKRLIS